MTTKLTMLVGVQERFSGRPFAADCDCTHEARRAISLLLPCLLLQAGLLQDRDLPSMIELVLGDPFQHEADIVLLPRHPLRRRCRGAP